MKKFAIAIFIFLVSFVGYTYSMRVSQTTDSLPNNWTALNVLFNKRLDLNNLRDDIRKKGIINTTITNSHGVTFSKTPPVVGILSIPTFIILNTYFGVHSLTPDQIVNTEYGQYVGKISASFYVALSAALLFLIILKITKRTPSAVLLTFVYSFGTNVFNTASQANWQHGISLFFITLLLFFLISRPGNFLALTLSGIILGLLTQIRISNLFYLPFVLIYLYFTQPDARRNAKNIPIILCGFLLTTILVSILYLRLQIPYGYGEALFLSLKEISPVSSFLTVVSILFSFNFGLFFFSPILLLALLSPLRKNLIAISSLVVISLFISSLSVYKYWLGGVSLNARMLTETLPVWVLLLTFSWQTHHQKTWFRLFFLIFVTTSIFFNLLTTYAMDWLWYPLYLRDDPSAQLANAWYKKPALIPHLLDSRLIHIEKLTKNDDKITVRSTVFRPNIKTRELVKLEDTTTVILNLNDKN